MRLSSFGLSDVGNKREKNEDSFLVSDPLELYMVADGMGGHVGGEFASRLAVETVQGAVAHLNGDPEATLQEDLPIRVKPGDFRSWLQYAILLASHRIFEKAEEDPSLQGMGTTAAVLLFRKSRVYVANVGDSRGYRIRGNKIEQLTTDHSLVGEQMRAGILKPKEAREHRLRNIITRSVGFQNDVEVDVEARPVRKGDMYLLCSDGLYNLVEDREILDVVTHQEMEGACRHLIDIANAKGGDDNITVVLAKVDALEGEMDEEEAEESTMQC